MMKKKYCVVLTLILVLVGCIKSNNWQDDYADISSLKIVVATDTHYLAPSLTDHGSFFTELINTSDGKVMAYSEALMESFVSDMIAMNPDVVIVSGDLTFNGEKESHKELAKKFTRIEEEGIRVLVIPGNHDLYNQYSVNFRKDGYLTTSNINTQEFIEIYHTFGYDDATERDKESLSYVVDLNDELRLLMLDVNTLDYPNDISSATYTWMESMLQKARDDKKWVMAVSHQNVYQHSDAISKGFVIESHNKLQKLYEKYHVLFNLSGHIHMQHTYDAKVPEIVTSSLAVTPNQYGVIDIANKQMNYMTQSVDVSSWAKSQGSTDENLLDFKAYSRTFFIESSYQKGIQNMEDYDDKEALASFFAELNAEYFSGTNRFDVRDDEFKIWKQRNTGFKDYFKSIEKEAGINHTVFDLDFSK